MQTKNGVLHVKKVPSYPTQLDESCHKLDRDRPLNLGRTWLRVQHLFSFGVLEVAGHQVDARCRYFVLRPYPDQNVVLPSGCSSKSFSFSHSPNLQLEEKRRRWRRKWSHHGLESSSISGRVVKHSCDLGLLAIEECWSPSAARGVHQLLSQQAYLPKEMSEFRWLSPQIDAQ